MLVTVFLAVLGCTATIWVALAFRIHREGIGLRYAIWHDAAGRLRWIRCSACEGLGVEWLHDGMITAIPPALRVHTVQFRGRRQPKVGNYMNCRTCNGTGQIVSRELEDPAFRERLFDNRWPS